MKATDLMLGDWVKSRGKIEQVREVYEGYICTDSFEDSHDYYFEPIPITPEILDKNGWEWDGVYAYLRHDDMLLEWYGEEGLLRDYRFVQYGHGQEEIFKSRPGIMYVHKLQHALRLCGIEKEIII